jgi:hypothetical protein
VINTHNIFALVILSAAAPLALGQATTRPASMDRAAEAAAATTTQPGDDVLPQVVDLMRDGKFAKASQLLDKVYNATPAAQRTRPMVLNRAILDLAARGTIMRGLRDLSEYLAKHRGEDEQATNLLAACLDAAANDAKLKAGPIWQAAYKEWDRRNYLLDHSHAGWRRWGAKWVTDDETTAREAKVAELRRVVVEQADYIDKLMDQAYEISDQEQAALDAASAFAGTRDRVSNARQYLQGIQQSVANYRRAATMYPTLVQQYNQRTGKNLKPVDLPTVQDPVNPQRVRNLAGRESQLYMQEITAAAAAQQIGADLAAVYRQIVDAQNVLAGYNAQLAAIRPEWPSRFDPIDPHETAPTPTALPATPPTVSPNVAALNAQAAAAVAAAAAKARNAAFPTTDPTIAPAAGAAIPHQPQPPQQLQQQKQQTQTPAAVGPGADLYGGGQPAR